MPSDEINNSDLIPNPGVTVPKPGDVETIDIPQGSSPMAPRATFNEDGSTSVAWDPFTDDEPDQAEQLFNETPEKRIYNNSVRGINRPISASLLAIALADPRTVNDLTLLNEKNLEAARNLLDQQQEYNARLQVSHDRTVDTLRYIDNLEQQFQERAKTETVPEGVQDLIRDTYETVLGRDREQDARTALEFEAIDRIRGYMTQGDPHEAYLVREATFGNGTAEKVIVEEATRSLIAMQRLEELEARYQDSGWIRGFFNGLIRAVPFADAFSASGIMDDAGVPNDATGLVNFILRGDNLMDQRAALWNLPLDEFAEALAPNGAVMKSIEANADWLMNDPTRALEVSNILLASTEPDPEMENFFGVLDPALLAVPYIGRVGRVGDTLAALGARRAAVDQTTRAALETINRGPEAARTITGVSAEELTESLTPTMFMSQTGVSLSTDVAAAMKTAEELRQIFPEIMAVHRMDNAQDIRAAFEVYQKELLDGKYGEHIKDVKFVESNVRTGASKEFADEVAEDGATVYRLEVTIGKKDGGGYAKPSYLQGLFEKFGRQGEVFQIRALPEVPKGHVRMWRSGSASEKGRGGWYTSSRDYAEQLRAQDNNALYYTDVPDNHPAFRDWDNNNRMTTINHDFAPNEVKGIRVEDEGVYRDEVSGQYFGRMNVAVRLDGFTTSTMNTPDARMSFLRSSARTADRTAVGKGINAGNAANRFLRQVERTLKASVKGVGRKERNALNQIIMKGQNEAKWYDETEFALHYERLYGSYPSATVQQAYDSYRSMHDMVYLVRNDAVYITKYNQGFESHRFRMAGRDVDLDGVVNRDPQKRPLGARMWDASSDRWLADNIPADEVQKMVDEGYVMVRLDQMFEFPDGRVTNYIMVKQQDLMTRPLRRVQLNYSQGGSRAYDASHFIKQAAEDVDGNLINPRTWIAGKNLNEMKTWADDMNRALALRSTGETDLIKYEDIFLNRPGYPTPQEFLDMVDQRQLSLKHNFEVVDDQTLPSAYFASRDPQALRYVDMEQTGLDSYHDTMGRMYYGTKGEHLKDVTGDFAATIDPWNTLNATVNEAAKTYSFSGYKQNLLERFKNTYGAYLDLDNLSQADSLYGLANAPIKRNIPRNLPRVQDVTAKIRQEQAAIRRLMNFETQYEKTIRENWRSAADWVLGNAAEGTLRARGRDAMYWLEKNNPIQFMRTLAFDANLGMWNIGQLFIQSSTIVSAMALHGDRSLKGLKVIYPLKTYAVSGYNEGVLDVLAKQGVWKGGFDTVDEFKAYMRAMRDSNLYEVSGTNLSMVREYGANKIFGASSVYNAISEKGRMFFYFAEQANRSVASRIAWDILKERGIKPGTAQFRERFAMLTDDYSFNMMSQTSASFQHGLPSIPTQFWAYGFRMMDAMFGYRFTPAQKVRLVMANATMAGAAGVPGGVLLKELYEQWTNQPISIEETEGWIARGLFDGLAYAITGADVEIGSRVGTAEQMQNIVKDLFGAGEYGEKSVYEMMAGASGAKVASAVPALWDVVYWNAAEVSGDTGGIAKDTWLQLGKEVASTRGILNSYLAYRYNAFWSRNGTLVENDLPDADAFFFALGFTPGQQSDLSFYFEQGEDTAVDEAAKQLTKWRQDAFTFPDKYEENRQKAQAMMALFTPSERKKIRERAYNAIDDSMLSTLQRRWEKDMVESEFYDEMVPMIEEKVETNAR